MIYLKLVMDLGYNDMKVRNLANPFDCRNLTYREARSHRTNQHRHCIHCIKGSCFASLPSMLSFAKAQQTVDTMQKDIGVLKAVAEACLGRTRFTEDVQTVFESERVRRHLESMMDLIIEALELIDCFNFKSNFRELLSFFIVHIYIMYTSRPSLYAFRKSD